MKKLFLYGIVIFTLVACRKPTDNDLVVVTEKYELRVPEGFPMPDIPNDNPLTVEGIALGKKMFFDKRFSADQTISCASCHLSSAAFCDNSIVSTGVGGALGVRNSPTLANLAYGDHFFFEGGVPTLELQVLAPIHNPVEMDFKILDIIEILKQDEEMVELAKRAYDREIDSFVITRAIASYERTMISGNSRYDQYTYQGQENALTEEEKNGMELFFSDELKCAQCHVGFNFTNDGFYNIGLYEEYQDNGRERITHLEEDIGKFKVPTLRNVELTYPYMHDGSIATLEEVVDLLNTGGVDHPNKSEWITPLNLTEIEKGELVAFLKSLTDHEFINNNDFKQ